MYRITVQCVNRKTSIPDSKQFKIWAKAALQNQTPSGELTIRIVDEKEITTLNSTYRKKNKPTNVLSFPMELPEGIEFDIKPLGDIVICAEVVKQEAKLQEKTEESHWAHMVVHGTLHLLGYDHENEIDADKMESLEINILKSLGFNNPYAIKHTGHMHHE